MSIDYYLACHQCKKVVDVASDGAGGFTFYRGEPECMQAVGNLLSNCLKEHPQALGFVVEQSPEWETYEHLEWNSINRTPEQHGIR